jgi:CRP-like cAMP-binding protein
VLTSEDVLTLLQEQLARADGDSFRLCDEIGRLRRRLEQVELTEQTEWRAVGTVHLAVPRSSGPRKLPPARLARAGGRPVPGTPVRGHDMRTLYVPVDGPATFSYDTFRVPLAEGELIGETSCMYRTPRPATVVVTRACYVLEMLRNILDQMYKDPAFRDFADELHERREAVGWRKLSLFADLNDTQYDQVRGELRLVRAEPGAVICDEHERGEAVYVVSRGLVQVARNVSSLLAADAVCDWPRLWTGLREGVAGGATPRARLWQLLCEKVPGLGRWEAEPALQDPAVRAALVQGFNKVLALPGLIDEPAFRPLAEGPPLRETLAGALRRRELGQRGREWPDRDARRCNRLLLEALLQGAFRPLAGQGGLETTLAYRAPGEWFGELALLTNRPQEVTCTACGHPGDEGMVELVRIPAAAFERLLGMSPAVRERVGREAERRQEEARERMRSPLWVEAGPVQASQAFEELGLLQGQKLMLIDLDRCTRCEECVHACADTHDGLARLALDGPRLGKYLVPTTCAATCRAGSRPASGSAPTRPPCASMPVASSPEEGCDDPDSSGHSPGRR